MKDSWYGLPLEIGRRQPVMCYPTIIRSRGFQSSPRQTNPPQRLHMRTSHCLPLFCILVLNPWVASASDQPRVTIVSTQAAPRNNLTTASPVALQTGIRVMVQCDVPTRVLVGSTSSVVSNNTTAVYVERWEKYDITFSGTEKVVATYPVSASDTSTCNVYKVD